MKVLVLGAYGLIGQSIVDELQSHGHQVVGFARNPQAGKALRPEISWVEGDLNHLTAASAWNRYLDQIDAVVNASGALQSGMKDNLGSIQDTSICALIEACTDKGVSRFIQISAPGASLDSNTEFYRTKAAADKALRESPLNWTTLKPGLVISPTAYGGTSLLRMLAAVPVVQPITLADAQLQTIGVDDVARAVTRSLDDKALSRREFDLVSAEPESLQAIVLQFRQWLGFPTPKTILKLPNIVGRAIARVADLTGALGWRSPLRTTALTVLEDGVLGDPEPWRKATGEEFASLKETLKHIPSTRQERVFARTQLVFPILVALFALFWINSGLIGLWQIDSATALIAQTVGQSLAVGAVVGGSLADILIGTGLLIRKTFITACFAAIGLSIIYLVMGTIITPQLWADPLGPLLKILPVIALSLALIAMAEER